MWECEWGEGKSFKYGVIGMIVMMMMEVLISRKGRGYKEEKMRKGDKEEKKRFEYEKIEKRKKIFAEIVIILQTTKENRK